MGRAAPVVKARRLTLVPGASVDAAARQMLGNCLAQVTGNLAALAKGAGTPEHVHQARVGIRRARTALDALEPAQSALGEFNDLSVAESYFRARVVDQPAAWFAVGWLAAQGPAIVEACGRTLRVAAEAEPYWARP